MSKEQAQKLTNKMIDQWEKDFDFDDFPEMRQLCHFARIGLAAQITNKCTQCDGYGTYHHKCHKCHGTGRLNDYATEQDKDCTCDISPPCIYGPCPVHGGKP